MTDTPLQDPREASRQAAQERYDWTLSRLYQLARVACGEILQFHPDLIVVLAHGGWAALWATRALWAEMSPVPFPRVLVTNLGREKIGRYEEIPQAEPGALYFLFKENCPSDYKNGFFLAWLSRQTDWQDALRRQIRKTLDGAVPNRVLVLDDTTWEGGTYHLALGLLRDTLPGCEVRMLAGCYLEWRLYLTALWKAQHPLDQGSEVNREIDGILYKLTPGTEDVEDAYSLEWRPITPESELVKSLSPFLPAETCLELPTWVETSIRQGVLENYHQEKRNGPAEDGNLCAPVLDPKDLLIKTIYLRGKITRRETAACLQIAPTEAGKLLAQMAEHGSLLPQGRGGGAFYILPPSATLPENQLPARPLLDAWWVGKNQLLISAPLMEWAEDTLRTQMDWLFSQGIRCWIDLDEIEKTSDAETGAENLKKRARERGVELQVCSFPVNPHKSPARKLVQSILEAVHRAVDDAQPVYLHGGGVGTADAIAGCYLVSSGLTGEQALAELVRLRQDTVEPWRRVPARRALRRMVNRWGAAR